MARKNESPFDSVANISLCTLACIGFSAGLLSLSYLPAQTNKLDAVTQSPGNDCKLRAPGQFDDLPSNRMNLDSTKDGSKLIACC